MHLRHKALLALGLALWMPAAGFALTVEEAYQAIPHARTVFIPSEARMPAVERDFLVKLFDVCDTAIVAKVVAGRTGKAKEAYEPVWKTGAALKAPTADLRKVETLIQTAIKAERAYLEDWGGTFNRSDPRVQAASSALHQAYSDLLRLYPNENAHNKQAFFDYLCALDFI